MCNVCGLQETKLIVSDKEEEGNNGHVNGADVDKLEDFDIDEVSVKQVWTQSQPHRLLSLE